MRGATRSSWATSRRSCNFNPRSSCEERHRRQGARPISLHISIHAPHARSDEVSYAQGLQQQISIHAPHARSDVDAARKEISRKAFQSTLLMRGATSSSKLMVIKAQISIHAPHARSDCLTRIRKPSHLFQSTLLMRGATVYGLLCWSVQRFQSTLLMRGATRRR